MPCASYPRVFTWIHRFPLFKKWQHHLFLSHSTKIPNEIGSKSRRRWRRSNLGRGCLYPRRPNSVGKSSLVLTLHKCQKFALSSVSVTPTNTRKVHDKETDKDASKYHRMHAHIFDETRAGRCGWQHGLLESRSPLFCPLARSLARSPRLLPRTASSLGWWLAMALPSSPSSSSAPLRRPQPAADRCTRRPFSRGPSSASRSPSAPAPPISLSLSTKTESWPL